MPKQKIEPVKKRQLKDLRGIGKAMLADFELLKIQSVEQLAKANGKKLYDQLCVLTESQQDPCVWDTFECAIAQAKDPHLPKEQCDWWWWSRIRKKQKKASECN